MKIVLKILFCLFPLAVYSQTWFGYAPNNNPMLSPGGDSVTAYNIMTNSVLTTIAFPQNSQPAQLAITPNAQTVYVTTFGTNTVIPIDVATNIAGTPISVGPMGNQNAIGIAITPDGTRAYIANEMSQVVPVDLTTNTALAPIPLPVIGTDIAITPDGTRAYVTDFSTTLLTIIDITQNTVIGTINLPGQSFFIGITPDGTKAYVTTPFIQSVVVVDIASNTVQTAIPVGIFALGIGITANGKTALIGSQGNSLVVPIDISTNTPGTPIPVGGQNNFGIGITPDSQTAYVPNFNANTITVINLATHQTFDIPAGQFPTDFEITPDQAPTALFTFTMGGGGAPTVFDASASFSPVGTIALYAWNFGDGQTLVTTSPITSHVYTTAGPFTVTLTVTNTGGTSTFQTYTGHVVSNNGGPSATLTQVITLKPLPPRHFRGKLRKDIFLTQTDYIHALTWKASKDPAVVAYILKRNGKVIAKIRAQESLEYQDHNRHKNRSDVYTLTAVTASGVESDVVEVIVP